MSVTQQMMFDGESWVQQPLCIVVGDPGPVALADRVHPVKPLGGVTHLLKRIVHGEKDTVRTYDEYLSSVLSFRQAVLRANFLHLPGPACIAVRQPTLNRLTDVYLAH
jgi:hypothetical protein